NPLSCGGSFPPSFTCPQNSTCQTLGNGPNFTIAALCCASGTDCTIIPPVSCDTSLMDAGVCPGYYVHAATEGIVSLPACGQQCCPPNYFCRRDSQCVKDLL